MKFKSVGEFTTYLEDEFLNKKVLKQHLNIFEESRLRNQGKMIDIYTNKTNRNWDWMKYDTLYLIRSNSEGYMGYLYAPSDEHNIWIEEDERRIYYAQSPTRRIEQFLQGRGPFGKRFAPHYKFDEINKGSWDAPDEEAKWVQAILEINLGERVLMNWNDIPWERLK